MPLKFDADIKYIIYEIHKLLGNFLCNNIESRFYLASIYTEAGLKCTGSEAALEIMRHNVSNKPLTSN
jgi:hypothetical protein